MECPKCKGPMRIIALIDDPGVVREILVHMGRWEPGRAAPVPPEAWPAHANLALMYHPISEIA
jgi:hypothetical protein